jgi:hypothetical protein
MTARFNRGAADQGSSPLWATTRAIRRLPHPVGTWECKLDASEPLFARFAPVRASVLGRLGRWGLLKPPTTRCYVENVARSGGAIPPPPGLPTYSGQKRLIPLGKISDRGGERIVRVPVAHRTPHRSRGDDGTQDAM